MLLRTMTAMHYEFLHLLMMGMQVMNGMIMQMMQEKVMMLIKYQMKWMMIQLLTHKGEMECSILMWMMIPLWDHFMRKMMMTRVTRSDGSMMETWRIHNLRLE